MAISKEKIPQNNELRTSSSRSIRSSRPSGVAEYAPSRSTSVQLYSDTTEDEMKYGRKVRIIKASSKKQGGIL